MGQIAMCKVARFAINTPTETTVVSRQYEYHMTRRDDVDDASGTVRTSQYTYAHVTTHFACARASRDSKALERSTERPRSARIMPRSARDRPSLAMSLALAKVLYRRSNHTVSTSGSLAVRHAGVASGHTAANAHLTPGGRLSSSKTAIAPSPLPPLE